LHQTTNSGLIIAQTAYQIADEKNALQPIILNVSELTSLCSFIIIMSCKVKSQVRSLAKLIETELSKQNFTVLNREGLSNSQWALLDYGEVLINIMYQPDRDHYQLEEIWRKASKVEFN
jgi:ribosome-associated protein